MRLFWWFTKVLKTKYISSLVLAIACFLVFSVLVSAQEDGGKEQETLSFIDRIAVRTNAVDWLLTIPNIGVEFQITNDPYKYMTVGLSAKYNWNSYHGTTDKVRYQPPAVYDVLDIRPEFRYYYRTTPKEKTKIDAAKENRQKARANIDSLKVKMQTIKDEGRLRMYREWLANAEKELELRDSIVKASRRSFPQWFKEDVWTTDRKNPRSWRAHYIGAYASYANYAFKFGERGIRGANTIGFGATVGYVLPLYEYKKGAIDIDLGFSVGIQLAKHDVFTHNMDGNFYSKVMEGRSWYGTQYSSDRLMPYPVVSELRVAFVWRKQSIKYEAKVDEATIKKKKDYERVCKVLREEVDKVMPVDYKVTFDDINKEYLGKWRQNDTLYREKFVETVMSQKEDMLKQVYGMTESWTEKQVDKFVKEVGRREQEMIRFFDSARARERRKEEKTVNKKSDDK